MSNYNIFFLFKSIEVTWTKEMEKIFERKSSLL